MTLWLVRAGRYGEREDLALSKGLALLGWQELPSLTAVKTRESLATAITAAYPDEKSKTRLNWESQLLALPCNHDGW